MLPIHTILHPTDFSDRSENAFRLACGLARDYGAQLVVLHVTVFPTIGYGEGVIPPDPELIHQEAQVQLGQLLAQHPGVHADSWLEEGDPATEVLRVAKVIGANLIVMGTHGRTGLSRLLMGSVAEQVVRKATCPVLTVTTPFHDVELAGASSMEGAEIGLPYR